MDNHDRLDMLQDKMIEVWADHGWVQGKMGDTKSGFCMMGAWSRMAEENQAQGLAHMPSWLMEAISHTSQKLFGESGSVAHINDNVVKSQEDARLLVKHAFSYLHEMLEEPDEAGQPVDEPGPIVPVNSAG